jgi:hypothetical protein
MPVVTLDQYAQVKTSSGTPKTTYRPSLAYLEKGSILYMAYPGENPILQGRSLRRVWWVQSTRLGYGWIQNEEVMINGADPLLTVNDVAMVVFQGVPGILSPYFDASVTAAWFDGNQWSLDVAAPQIKDATISALVATVTNNTLHVFYNTGGKLIHLFRTAAPFDFSPANWTQQTTDLPVTPLSATITDDGKIFLLCSPRSDSGSELLNYIVADPPEDPTNWETRMAAVEPAAGDPLPTTNAAIGADIYGVINLVYRAHGKGEQLYFASTDNEVTTFATLEAIPAPPLKLTPCFEVETDFDLGNHKAKCQGAPFLYSDLTDPNLNFNFLTHQGASSNDIWFGRFINLLP